VSRYVRTVTHESIKEILDRLRVKAAGHTDTRTPADPAPSFQVSEGHPIEPENDDAQRKHPTLPEEDVLNPSDSEPHVDGGAQEEVTASPEEIRAAIIIEAAYHRVTTRKKEVLKLKGINATRARIWSLLYDHASSMEWSRRTRYKLLMQGPLVHVLVCLDGVKMFADQMNKDSKKQLQGDDHSRLEELIETSDRSR